MTTEHSQRLGRTVVLLGAFAAAVLGLLAPGAPHRTAAAQQPALDPPGNMAVFHGLRASPKTSILPEANSMVLSLPRQMAPACRRRAATAESSAAT